MTKIYSSTGKWILGGEHAVLRGCEALVFPLPSLQMKLIYEPMDEDLKAHFKGETGSTYQILFYGLVDRALEILGRARGTLKGKVTLESNLPLGNGLGASAALCVVVAKWLADLGWVNADQLEEFCRELENLFHGESSGVDVAVVLSGHPLVFARGQGSEPLKQTWKPQFYLSPSGEKGLTHSCIEKVKALCKMNPEQGQKLDAQMGDAVQTMKAILASPPQENSLWNLGQAIQKARQCFEEWGLTEGVLDREMNVLLQKGALAAKPTGSGAGGFILSLWAQEPPAELKGKMIQAL